MVYFNITVRNPFWWDRWSNIKHWAGRPRNNKCWEVQVMTCEELLRVEFDWTARQDHAGLHLELGLLGYKIDFSWYDTRHWDTEKGCWINYDDPVMDRRENQ